MVNGRNGGPACLHREVTSEWPTEERLQMSEVLETEEMQCKGNSNNNLEIK